jgi:hypothetical protein
MRALLLGLVATLSLHCAESQPPLPPPTLVADPPEPEAPDTPVSSPPAEPGPAPGEPPKDCPFRVAQTCYLDADAACQAAGCTRDKCRIMESYPAQVACD